MSIHGPEKHIGNLPPAPTDETTMLPPIENQYGRNGRNETSRFGLGTKIGALAAGAIIIGAGILGFEHANGSDNTEPKHEAGSSAPAKAGDKAVSREVSTPEFGISTAEYGNNPKELIKEYIRQENEFYIAGIGNKEARSDERHDMSDEDFVAKISKPINQQFVDNIFINDWEDNSRLSGYVDSILEIANATRKVRLTTTVGTSKPYYRAEKIQNVVSTSDPLTVSYRYDSIDNRNENNASKLFADNERDVNGTTGGSTITWVNVDGQLKIADVQYFSDK